MPSRRLLTALLAAFALPTASAHAALFSGEVIDGPSPDILSIGGFDLAPADGVGAVTYLRNDGGVPHVFISRIQDGTFQPPERIDAALGAAASDPVVAAGSNGRLLVAWVADGTVFVNTRPSAAAAWTGPVSLGPGRLPAIDMGFNDNAYLAWSTGDDVLAARLLRTSASWEQVQGPLDLDPANTAGSQPNTRPSIAVSAEGLALAAWGEVDGTGRSHVVARRIDGTRPSTVADLSLDQLEGRPGGGADAPVAVIQSDSSYGWVVFRQAFTENGEPRLRGVARQMLGSAFQAPIVVDGQSWPGVDVGLPNMAVSGSGTGFSATPQVGGPIFGRAVSADDEWTPFSTRLDSAPVPVTQKLPVFYSEDKNGVVAWPAPDGMLRVRPVTGIAFQPEQVVTKPELGPVDWNAGVAAGGDRYFNGGVVAIQVDPEGGRRLVANIYDQAPGGFSPASSSRWYRKAPARLYWRAPTETWGPLRYTVEVDGKPVGETDQLSYPTRDLNLGSGAHMYRIVARDVRGQTSATPTRLVKIDEDAPNVTVTLSGARRHGAALSIRVRAIDTVSGSETPTIFFGDGRSETGRSARHVYARPGRYTLTVRAPDGAGNVATERIILRIR